MNQITMRGVAAEIRWGYHKAADLGAWTLDGSTVTAAITSPNVFRLSQAPLTFLVHRPNGLSWVWPIRDLFLSDSTVTATVGPPE